MWNWNALAKTLGITTEITTPGVSGRGNGENSDRHAAIRGCHQGHCAQKISAFAILATPILRRRRGTPPDPAAVPHQRKIDVLTPSQSFGCQKLKRWDEDIRASVLGSRLRRWGVVIASIRMSFARRLLTKGRLIGATALRAETKGMWWQGLGTNGQIVALGMEHPLRNRGF